MNLFVGVVVGFFVCLLLWQTLSGNFAHQRFQRINYRGNGIPTAGGLLLVLAAVVLELFATIFDLMEHALTVRRVSLVAIVLFGILGLVDDLWGDSTSKGFRGHLRALAAGKLTTGGIKLLGGGFTALGIAWMIEGNLLDCLVSGALIALMANLTNLLDRAPGRSTKVTACCFSVLTAATAGSDSLIGSAVVTGAAISLLVYEFREEVMLGDTGSNLLGATLAVGIVDHFGTSAAAIITLFLLLLNLSSEKISFSAVIEGNRVLNALDMAGRRM